MSSILAKAWFFEADQITQVRSVNIDLIPLTEHLHCVIASTANQTLDVLLSHHRLTCYSNNRTKSFCSSCRPDCHKLDWWFILPVHIKLPTAIFFPRYQSSFDDVQSSFMLRVLNPALLQWFYERFIIKIKLFFNSALVLGLPRFHRAYPVS